MKTLKYIEMRIIQMHIDYSNVWIIQMDGFI